MACSSAAHLFSPVSASDADLPLRSLPSCSHSSPSRGLHRYPRRQSLQRRRAFRAHSFSPGRSLLDEPAIMEVPCLPFTPSEVFIPTATKTLHLYEARFLALLEEAMGKYDNMFAHIVIEPVADDREDGVLSFAAKHGCLAHIENVRQMDIGALVTIRGIGRVNLANLTQLEPFLKGNIIPVQDATTSGASDIDAAVEALKSVLADVQRLQIKLRASKDELLQTPLENSLKWAEKRNFTKVSGSFMPSKAESLAFAALQPVASAGATELQALLQERMSAMEITDTLQRLHKVTEHAMLTRSSLAAKVALQSLQS